jgi:hypothetical protein
LERLGEIHDVSLRTGKYTIRDPVSMAERAGPMSIERLLKRISSRSKQGVSRTWAMRHLSRFDQLHHARMRSWLTASSTTRALNRVSGTRVALLLEKQALRGTGRALARAAGPVGLASAVAMDAYEIYGHVSDYRLGKLSQREFIIALARSGGGIGGAWAGAAGGGWAGVEIGALGGPWAWVTVPVGGVIGVMVGGTVGYLGGSYVGEFTAQAWYGSLDRDVRERVNRWFKETSSPVSM